MGCFIVDIWSQDEATITPFLGHIGQNQVKLIDFAQKYTLFSSVFPQIKFFRTN